MRELVWYSSFKRAFKQVTRKNPQLEDKIYDVLDMLRIDPFTPSLKTHKLRGKLEGSWACWVEYDCRIVFLIETDQNSQSEVIILADIGTHDQVY